MKSRQLVAVSLLAIFTARCATVSNTTYERVPVSSEPSGARVALDCGSAARHVKKPTPVVVTIPRRADPCNITLSKDGYERVTVPLKRQLSPAALANFKGAAAGVWVLDEACCDDEVMWAAAILAAGGAAFGVVGLAFDRATGAVFEHEPKQIAVALTPLAEELDPLDEVEDVEESGEEVASE